MPNEFARKDTTVENFRLHKAQPAPRVPGRGPEPGRKGGGWQGSVCCCRCAAESQPPLPRQKALATQHASAFVRVHHLRECLCVCLHVHMPVCAICASLCARVCVCVSVPACVVKGRWKWTWRGVPSPVQ